MKSFVADPGGCAVEGVGVRALACWNFVFESCRRHRCPSFANVVCLQVEVTVMGQSLVQRSPTEWCVCVCVSLSVNRCNNIPLHLLLVSG